MVAIPGRAAFVGGAVALAALALAPALAATQGKTAKRRVPAAVSLFANSQLAAGTFTPAAADPRLASAFARGSLNGGGFRFTPSATPGSRRAVTVAVRARSTPRTITQRSAETAAATPAATPTSVMPTAYNLGLSVGWKRFALSGDIAKIDAGPFPGGRESMDVGLSYSGKKWSTRVAVGADRATGPQVPLLVTGERGYSADLSGSFALTKDVDLTGGVRYRLQRDRLQPIEDSRRDSQAVYIGTAFRF